MSAGEFPITNFFPVYDLLLSQINTLQNREDALKEEEIKDLNVKINLLDKLGRDMVYVFIRIHSLRNSNSKLLEIPYGGDKVSTRIDGNDMISDVKFDIREFPPVLSRMLLRFSELHIHKMSEDSRRK